MRNRSNLIAALGVLILLGGPVMAEEKSSHEAAEQSVPISDVPQAARDAAQRNLGGTISKASVTEENGQKIYELEARDSSGHEKSVHVSADGKILPPERKDDGDDD